MIFFILFLWEKHLFKKLNINSNDFKFCVELPIKMQIANMKYTSMSSFEKKNSCKKSKCREGWFFNSN